MELDGFVPFADAMRVTGLTKRQFDYAKKREGFPTRAIKRHPQNGRVKLIHIPTLTEFAPSSSPSCVDELRQLGHGNLDPYNRSSDAKGGKKPVAPKPDAPADGGDDVVEGTPVPFLEAQRRKMLHDARKAEVEADKAEGSVIERDVINRDVTEAFQVVRDLVLSIPRRISADLAASKDAHHIEQELNKEIRGALHAAADRIERFSQN